MRTCYLCGGDDRTDSFPVIGRSYRKPRLSRDYCADCWGDGGDGVRSETMRQLRVAEHRDALATLTARDKRAWRRSHVPGQRDLFFDAGGVI